MRAAILSIGDELTSGQVPEANARWLASQLAERAVTTVELRVVGDDRTAIAAAFRELAARADVRLSTGGIGPTADDLTRAALCDVLTHDTRPLANPRGTALGIAGRLDRCRIYVMPGPPAEMRTMYRDQVLPEEGIDLEKEIQTQERVYLQAALERAGGVRTKAAELLGMSYRSFRHYAKKYKI